MRYVTFAAVLIVALSVPMFAQNLDARLQKAIQNETVTGDLKAAIEEYRQIAAAAGAANRRIAALALMRMADGHRKLGDAAARALYERIVREYGDQPDAVTEARARLVAFGPAPARGAAQSARQIWSGTAVDLMGAPTADGRFLTYTDWDTGDLAVRDLRQRTQRRLTNTGGWEASGDFAEFSVPSPDGRLAAYAWYTEKAAPGSAYDLRIIPLSGEPATPRVLHSGRDIGWVMPGAWTPDGTQLVFVRTSVDNKQAELAIVSVASGDVRVLRSLHSASQRTSVSPDGRWIVYDGQPGPNRMDRDLFLIGVDGTGHVVLDTSPSDDQLPVWTPDGSAVVFVSDRTNANGLWRVPVQAGTPAGPAQLIKPNLGAFYPLGMTSHGALVYVEGGGDSHTTLVVRAGADLRIAEPPQPLTPKHVNSNFSGAWSPDGRLAAYYAYRRGNARATTLVIRALDDGTERELPLPLQVNRGSIPAVRWFPDGLGVLVVARDPVEKDNVFYRVDVATGAHSVVHRTRVAGAHAAAMAAPVLAPDGGALYYIASPAGTNRLDIRKLDLRTRQDVLVREGWFYALALSGDGATLAYLGNTESGTSRVNEIGVLPLAGGTPRMLFRGPLFAFTRSGGLTFSADGRHIMFVRDTSPEWGRELWSLPVAGGQPVTTGLSVKGVMKNPQFHPDGRRLVFSVREPVESSVWILENFLPSPTVKK